MAHCQGTRAGSESRAAAPDPEQRDQHTDGVLRPDLRTFDSGPIDRDLLNCQSELLCQEENLDIECPARLLELREDALRRGAVEQFETALGVLDSRNGEQIRNPVESGPHELAQQGAL